MAAPKKEQENQGFMKLRKMSLTTINTKGADKENKPVRASNIKEQKGKNE